MTNKIIQSIIVIPFLRFALSELSTNDPTASSSWKLPILNVTDPHRCDFDIVHAADIVDVEEFRNLYPRKNRPVLIKGATRHWPAFTLWTKKYIYAKLAKWQIPGHGTGIGGIINDKTWSKDIYSGDSIRVKHPAAASPYIFSSIKEDGTISSGKLENLKNIHKDHFIGGESVSDFHPLDDIENDHFFSHWQTINGSKTSYYFSLGGTNSGLSLNTHQEGTCSLFHGVKRWFMIIPDEEHEYQRTYYEKTDAEFDQRQIDSEHEYEQQEVYWEDVTADKRESFVENVLPKMRRKPLECYQHPGDMIYVPNYYPHTVFNFGETVAISAIHLALVDTGYGA